MANIKKKFLEGAINLNLIETALTKRGIDLANEAFTTRQDER